MQFFNIYRGCLRRFEAASVNRQSALCPEDRGHSWTGSGMRRLVTIRVVRVRYPLSNNKLLFLFHFSLLGARVFLPASTCRVCRCGIARVLSD